MSDEKSGNEKGSSDNNMMVKAVAGVFGAVIAPILVTLGIKYSDVLVGKIADKPEAAKAEAAKTEQAKASSATPSAESSQGAKTASEPAKPAAAEPAKAATVTTSTSTSQPVPDGNKTPGAAAGTAGSASAAADSEKGGGRGRGKKAKAGAPAFVAPRTVGPVVRLFNLTNFDGWYKYVDKTSKSDSPPGKNKDPDGVYKIESGAIHISGQYWGTLTTEAEYENYHLTVEFKWGRKTWGGETKQARESGILLHGFGPDGAHMGWAPQSIKCQIIEGGTGDLVCYNSKKQTDVSFAVESESDNVGEGKAKKALLTYKPGAPLSTITHGFVRRLGNTNDWKNVTGFHRDGDIEKPTGEWNTLECICQAKRITVLLNGKLVNQAMNVSPMRGRISLQSHGAEIYFRKVELQQIAKN